MKVILTGANGNLGLEIQKLKSFEIIPVGRDNWNVLDNLGPSEADMIIHCAYDLKKNINEKTTEVLDSNILTTSRILEICKNKKIKKFVFISSCSVYGDSSNSSEEKPCTPITMNGHTKYFNEELVKNFCAAHEINYLILRAFNSYGGMDHFSVVQKIINCAKEKRTFTLMNNGIAERDFIHISDVARLTCLLSVMDLKNEIVNIGSGHSVKIIELVEAIGKKFGPIQLKNTENENEAVFSRANIKKLNRLTPFKPINIFDYINSL